MTMHAAKGLEFDLVFLPGWEEGLFPHQKAIAEEGKKGLEEERRLAYVGITRAKKELCITYAESRRIFNEYVKSDPSRFISEIECAALHKVSSNQNYSSNAQSAMRQKYSSSQTQTTKTIPMRTGDKPGSFVSHSSFGRGMVIKTNGDNLEIAFSHYGVKVIKKEFLTFCD